MYLPGPEPKPGPMFPYDHNEGSGNTKLLFGVFVVIVLLFCFAVRFCTRSNDPSSSSNDVRSDAGIVR